MTTASTSNDSRIGTGPSAAPANASTAASLTLFGAFILRDGSGRHIAITSKKNRALVAILALSPHLTATRERLASLLWGDRGEEQARGSLRQSLAVLRRELKDADLAILEADDEQIGLVPAVEIDVAIFERLASSSEAKSLARAAALYRDAFLANAAVRDAAFEEWLAAERRRLNDMAIGVLDRLCVIETGQARIEFAKRLIGLDSLREASHRALMRAYAEAGEKALAVQHYATCRGILKAELGVEPAAETRNLYQSILAGGGGSSSIPRPADNPAASVVAAELPNQATAAGSAGAGPTAPPLAAPVRRLAAVMIADAVGYSEMMRADEVSTYRLFKSDLESIFVPIIAARRGRIVKTTGDGVLAEFASIVDCVQCALDIQNARPKAEVGGEGQLDYRIGINLGDLITEPDDIYGDGVNIASRLQGLAVPGGILLSGDAYRQVAGKLVATFEDLGERHLEGLHAPVRVYRIGPKHLNGGTGGAAPAVQRNLSPAVPSIAVLPFDNLSGDSDQGYFSDGITNDILTDLSKFSELFVIASHTVFTYKARTVSIHEIGRQLGVRYVVEGSVQRGGDRIRINIQLIDVGTTRHLWAERYDCPAQNLFQVQDDIVRTIVSNLVSRLDISEHQRVSQKDTESLETYDVYLRGRAAWEGWTRESNLEAQRYFRRAIELDRGFALAYGYLSYTLVQAWFSGWEPSPDTLRQARDLAQRAVELGPWYFESHWSLGNALLYSREYDRGMAELSRAVELNPNSADLLIDQADALNYSGRSDEALSKVQRAMRLNPFYPDSYLWTLGITLYHTGEYEAALEALRRIGNPPNLVRRHQMAANVRLGRIEEAKSIAQSFRANDPDYTLERERLWPYKDLTILESFIADLRLAGLPDKIDGGP